MSPEVYKKMLADAQVTKCREELDYQCKSRDNKVSVGLYFNCHGLCDLENKTSNTRVILTIYPGISTELKDCNDIVSEQVFMVFADDPLKAYTYKLSIDSEEGCAIINVLHFPEEGRELICAEEIKGLKKSVLPSHRTFRIH